MTLLSNRSKKSIATVAASSFLLVGLLAGCSNPYTPPSTEGLAAPKVEKEEKTKKEDLPPLVEANPDSDQAEKAPELPSSAEDEDLRNAEETFLNINPDSIIIPDTVKERFGEEADSLPRDFLYSIWLASTFQDFQTQELTPESDTALLREGMSDLFTGIGNTRFENALKNDKILAFHVYPHWVNDFTLVGGEKVTFDPEKIWVTEIKNVYMSDPVLQRTADDVDSVDVFYDRRVSMPSADGRTLIVESHVTTTMAPSGFGTWQIAAWEYEIFNVEWVE